MTSAKVWTTAGWLELAREWLDERLARVGIERISDLTQPRVRPWGTVLTAQTSAGVVWMKAPGPETVFEVGLYELLRELAPEWVLEPIAIDVERGWIILPDGGTAVRETAADPVASMTEILPRYGELQRRLTPHVDRLLAAGVADMRAPVVPERFDQALAAVRRRPHEKEVVERLAARRDLVVERAGLLTVAPSIDHNDLHLGNVFLAGGRPVFYDWGDSVVSHPFASMIVAIGGFSDTYGISADDPAIPRMRDSYLEAFSDLAPHRELVEQFDLACWVGVIARALVWERALGTQEEPPAEWATAPLETLGTLLADKFRVGQ